MNVYPHPHRQHRIRLVAVLAAFVCYAYGMPRLHAADARTDGSGHPAVADVVSVAVTGQPRNYDFAVGVASPDRGCRQYADWWEVLTEDGKLVYRRILDHSHSDEQPFVRSGGPVAIAPDTIVLVRAHVAPAGYGGRAMKGSVARGFKPVALAPGFAADVERLPPQPSGCAF
jgi:hypothetical protein